MRHPLFSLRLVVAAVALCMTPVTAAPAAASNEVTVATVPRARGTQDLGRAPALAPLTVAVTLRYRNERELEQLIALQSDPASPLFRHFLSNEQFNAAYAPSKADYARVIAVLQASGFRISLTYANDTVVDAVGTVGSANRLFSTDVHRVEQRGYGLRLANALPARVPAALGNLVYGVSGLETLTLLRPAYALAKRRDPRLAPDAVGAPLYGPVSTKTGYGGYGPLAFSQGYDQPDQHARRGTPYIGTGRTSGIVIDADFLDSDLTTFLSYFNVARTGSQTVRVPVDGGPPLGDGSSDSIESTLDVEAIVSNAPGTKLYVYEFPSFSNDRYITDAYNRVVSDNVVDTANSSFGGCETGDTSGAQTWDHLAQQGAAKGITFHASSGDYGADSCNTGTDSVSEPASGPHFAAIGGTSLSVKSDGTYVSETTWDTEAGASGGGVSQIFALPSWQTNVPGVIKGGRNLPDVSFDADPYPGMALYYGGSWNTLYDPIGGTSLSSPLFGAALTDANQYLGGRSGLAAVTMYNFLAKNGYQGRTIGTYFHDITAGCNDLDSNGYCAAKNYDQTTGIGSVVWWHYLE